MQDCYALMSVKHLVVDGSNIATEGRTLPSLAQLDEAVRAFITERPHDNYTVIVDATFEHRIDKSEKKLYDEALAANELIVTPAGTVGRGDRFILEVADKASATVLSNDSFQEFHGDYKWLFDQGRLVGGRPVPGVGWVFVERTPVRGPKSRMATRTAARKRSGPATAATSKEASAPMPVPTTPPPAKRRTRGGTKAAAEKEPKETKETKASTAPSPKAPAREPRKRDEPAGGTRRPQQPLNDQLPFIEFIADHLPGSIVEGEVVEFSSHGAYVQVGAVRCYIPLKNMGTPAPRSARDVLERGQTRSFVVQSIEAARRGIDLAVPGFESSTELAESSRKTVAEPTSEPLADVAPARPRRARAAKADKALPVAASSSSDDGPAPAVDKAPAAAGAKQPQSEATLAATKKAAGRKTAAKKSTARKSTAKKATAKKSTARKATAKRAPAKKATARKSTAKKRPAKKAAAKKATARKSTAKKSTARKSTAKKATAKKATKKRAPAKKAGARKATAKKATKKKATARKATAKKRPAKKAAAKKATAKKSGAKKAARKAPARKAAKKR
jgi:hypothetical protein